MAIINSMAEVKRISNPNRQEFFGYYDLKAYDKNDERHLYCSATFMDRLPKAEDVLELGYIDLKTGKQTKFAETTLWNFQQGCMLQWYGDTDNTVCYNTMENGGATCIHDLSLNTKKYTELPCAAISPDGRWGLSVNFGRIYDFRPGYGYVSLPDTQPDIDAPENDGVYLVDMITGKAKLIISYKDCLKCCKTLDNQKLLVNHITFNIDSSRFLFLLRNFSNGENEMLTTMITSDLDGNMEVLLENTYISHYFWHSEKEILVHCRPKDHDGLFIIEDFTAHAVELKSEWFVDDIHCISSPDGKYIIGDGYQSRPDLFRPMRDLYRPLFIYNPATERTEFLLKAESVIPKINDIRCDLHARWNRKGNKISFDTTDRGFREICEIDVSGINI